MFFSEVSIVFSNCVIYGPYVRKDGRMHVIICDKLTNKRTTMSYPKYLYQIYHGIELDSSDTIDHLDRDFRNNNISNLVVRKQSDHSSIDALRVSLVKLECKWCGCSFERRANVQDYNSKLLKAGPFCTKSCAGKYGKSVQLGGDILPPADRVLREDRNYFRIEK